MALKIVTVSDQSAGLKLGDYLRKLYPDLPESMIRRLFSSRDVKLDKKPACRDAVLSSGQELRVYFPDRLDESLHARMLRVIYEDSDTLLINKPAGISVVPEPSGSLSLTELCRLYAEESGPVSFPPSPCHRLDHKTSGLCLFAKNETALNILVDCFRNRTVEKHYICLVRGIPKPPSAVCRAFLRKDSSRARVTVLDHPSPGAVPIITGYETLESGTVSRLNVHLITGRTHQIRAHMAALGHPVLGDDLYGDPSFNRLQKSRSLKLCATSLKLDTGGRLPALDGKEFVISPPF